MAFFYATYSPSTQFTFSDYSVNTSVRTVWTIVAKNFFWVMILALVATLAHAQPTGRWALKPGIYFPQAPRPGQWRKSIGVVFTTTPPELTEEIRVNVPAIDFNIQRGLSKRLFLTGRLQTQFVQSNLGVGIRWSKPFSPRLFMTVGWDATIWAGALRIKDVFNSQAYGVQTFPNVSVGYKLTRDLRLTVQSEAIMDLYYRSQVGSLAVEYNRQRINGVAFSFILEQPFYHQRHVSIGLRAAYSNFNWQLWSLYDTFDRDLFYPQLIFGFIL